MVFFYSTCCDFQLYACLTTQSDCTVSTETAENGSCRKPVPLPGADKAPGDGGRESMSRKSQSLVQLRADASAYANRVRTGEKQLSIL